MNTPDQVDTTPESPLNALKRRWYLGAGLGLLGLAAGLGASTLAEPTYVAESRVAVGSPSLEARVVAGYSLGTVQLAADLARYVNDQQARDELADVLGADADAVDLVAASPIPESSIVRVEVTGTDRRAVEEGATEVAQALVDRVNDLTTTQPQEILADYTALSSEVARLETEVRLAQADLDRLVSGRRASADDVAAAEQRLTAASGALAVAEVQQTATGERYQRAATSTAATSGLLLVSEGNVTTDKSLSTAARYALAGLGAGLVLALVIASLLARRRSARAARARRDVDEAPTQSVLDLHFPEHAGRR